MTAKSPAAPAAATGAPSAVRMVAGDPFFRGASIAMLLSGIATSAAAPQIATFLVTDLHASLTTAGLFYLTNLLAPVAGYLVGARSDRTGHRLGLFRWCALAGAIGWLLIGTATMIWVPFVVSAVILGFAGAATSQIFAALHDVLQQQRTERPEGVVAVVRMAVTAGWVLGPMIGAFTAAAIGTRAMLLATAVCSAAQILPLGTLRVRSQPASSPTTPEAASEPRIGYRPLLLFTGLYVLVYAGESVKYAYLPIYMRDALHLPALLSGSIIGIQPLVELLLMPLAVLVARCTGAMSLMVVGAGFGVAANCLFAFSGTAAGLFAGQVLMGGVWGVFAALGIIVAQRFLPTAVATASAIFMSSTAFSQALGGVLGGLGSGVLGLPLVFVIPAVLGVLAVGGLALLNHTTASTERSP